MRLLLALAGFAVGFVVPALAQEQKTVDPEVRQQIEAVLPKYEDAFNKHHAAAIAALYAADTDEAFEKEEAGGSASGREAIEQRYAAHFASSPGELSFKLVQVYAIGGDVCAVSEFSRHFRSGKGHHAKICVREPDAWKIRMAYTN
jgi:ketosteroid isomerase-like protein